VLRPSATPPVSDEELKAQEQILAELKKLRGEKEGWSVERVGLQGQVTTLTRRVEIEVERGDFYKKALDKAEQMDKNAQKMDTNSLAIQTTLEARIAEKNEKIAELTDDLRSCQGNQKWIFGAGAIAGGVGGWLLKGQTQRFLGTSSFSPLSQPQLTIPSPLRPAKGFLIP
jgi:predicted RNase H-like nuclease (RuvC/YqgF family)